MDSELDAYLLSKSSITIGADKLPKPSENGVKKSISLAMQDSSPHKSGEIFRTANGSFSFSCALCGAVCENCPDILDHINSHFRKQTCAVLLDIEICESPSIAVPEFISIDAFAPEVDVIETVVTANGIPKKLANGNFQPRTELGTGIVRIIKRKRSKIKGTTDEKSIETPAKRANEESNFSPTTKDSQSKCSDIYPTAKEVSAPAIATKVVKIVKLKRVKLRPGNAEQKNGSKIHEDFAKRKSSSELRPALVVGDTNNLNESVPDKAISLVETEKPVYFRSKNRSCCYQCEMEPRIYELSDPRRHICLFCPIWFPNHIDFENHVQTIHNEDPNYVVCKDFHCYVCEKSFDFREYLTRHLKVHKETADHLCATCGSSFKTKSRLTAHMKKHEDQTFECDQCGKTFKQFVRLRKHLWCHNTDLSFICENCSKAFKMKRYLNLHMAVHDEAKINCRHCDATFHFKSVRRAHEKSRHNVV